MDDMTFFFFVFVFFFSARPCSHLTAVLLVLQDFLSEDVDTITVSEILEMQFLIFF